MKSEIKASPVKATVIVCNSDDSISKAVTKKLNSDKVVEILKRTYRGPSSRGQSESSSREARGLALEEHSINVIGIAVSGSESTRMVYASMTTKMRTTSFTLNLSGKDEYSVATEAANAVINLLGLGCRSAKALKNLEVCLNETPAWLEINESLNLKKRK